MDVLVGTPSGALEVCSVDYQAGVPVQRHVVMWIGEKYK